MSKAPKEKESGSGIASDAGDHHHHQQQQQYYPYNYGTQQAQAQQPQSQAQPQSQSQVQSQAQAQSQQQQQQPQQQQQQPMYYPYGNSQGYPYYQQAPQSKIEPTTTTNTLPIVGSDGSGDKNKGAFNQQHHQSVISQGQFPPPQEQDLKISPLSHVKPRFSTTYWEDQNTICYQVEARGIPVSRREDSNYINGTKLLNVVGMTRGRRDGILKGEKVRYAVKIGAMNLKGVWIPFERALELATNEHILDELYPLFVKDIKSFYQANLAQTTTANEDIIVTQPQPKQRRKRITKKKREEDQAASGAPEGSAALTPQPHPAQPQQYPYQYYQQVQQQYPYFNAYNSQQQYQQPPYNPYSNTQPQPQPPPPQQAPYSQYQSLPPQTQEYVQQYYNYYMHFQPQQSSAQHSQSHSRDTQAEHEKHSEEPK